VAQDDAPPPRHRALSGFIKALQAEAILKALLAYVLKALLTLTSGSTVRPFDLPASPYRALLKALLGSIKAIKALKAVRHT
jgi:hypothetical protein